MQVSLTVETAAKWFIMTTDGDVYNDRCRLIAMRPSLLPCSKTKENHVRNNRNKIIIRIETSFTHSFNCNLENIMLKV